MKMFASVKVRLPRLRTRESECGQALLVGPVRQFFQMGDLTRRPVLSCLVMSDAGGNARATGPGGLKEKVSRTQHNCLAICTHFFLDSSEWSKILPGEVFRLFCFFGFLQERGTLAMRYAVVRSNGLIEAT